MHRGVLEWGRSALTPELVKGKRVLEVGSRDLNGSLRSHVESLDPLEVIGIDIVEGSGVDMVMGSSDLVDVFGPESFDLILCTEMLEHCFDWEDGVYQMKECLKVGGWLVLTTRSPTYPQHDFPGDYWRFTPGVMTEALRDLDELSVVNDPGFMPTVDDVGFDVSKGWAYQPGVFALGKRQGIALYPTVRAEPAPGYQPEPQPSDLDPGLFDPIIREIEVEATIKLDIGSGGPVFERRDMTWKTVDKYMPADITADMWDLPFDDGTVDAIWSSHALEHVSRKQVIPTLSEWHRVLRRGGRLDILVPDLDYVARLWLESGGLDWESGVAVLGWVFGSQEHDGEYHKTGWNVAGLKTDVESVGFTVIEGRTFYTPEYSQESIKVAAFK